MESLQGRSLPNATPAGKLLEATVFQKRQQRVADWSQVPINGASSTGQWRVAQPFDLSFAMSA